MYTHIFFNYNGTEQSLTQIGSNLKQGSLTRT
jgi:bifunctional N-acetylglucosamine-1-phosphate-uridyltransferase/glucosamine-1-phosphate-acetyltransferase GlmU-like protein